MSPLLLDEKILALEAALTGAEIPHAFGGALALAYYATPRATLDIDLNVFLAPDEADRLLAAITPLGVAPPTAAEAQVLRSRGQQRLFWEHTPLDLFFAYDPLHEQCLARSRRVPFGDRETVPVLSAEDLAVFKVLFDRDKDWRDLRELLFALGGTFDAEYARGWLARILSGGDERLKRFDGLLSPADASP